MTDRTNEPDDDSLPPYSEGGYGPIPKHDPYGYGDPQ